MDVYKNKSPEKMKRKGKLTSRRLARTWANGVTISCSGVLSSNDDDDVVGCVSSKQILQKHCGGNSSW